MSPTPTTRERKVFELVLDLLDDATLNLLDTIVAARD